MKLNFQNQIKNKFLLLILIIIKNSKEILDGVKIIYPHSIKHEDIIYIIYNFNKRKYETIKR